MVGGGGPSAGDGEHRVERGRGEVPDARRRGLPRVPCPVAGGDGHGAHVRAAEQARAGARRAPLRRRLRPRAGPRHARRPHLLLQLRA